MLNSYYQKTIIKEMMKKHNLDHDPRHIEGYISLAYHNFSNISREEWENEVLIASECIKYAGIDAAESCAQSFGL